LKKKIIGATPPTNKQCARSQSGQGEKEKSQPYVPWGIKGNPWVPHPHAILGCSSVWKKERETKRRKKKGQFPMTSLAKKKGEKKCGSLSKGGEGGTAEREKREENSVGKGVQA